jgi:hypothetical protein
MKKTIIKKQSKPNSKGSKGKVGSSGKNKNIPKTKTSELSRGHDENDSEI